MDGWRHDDIRNGCVIVVAVCALYGGALALQPISTDNQRCFALANAESVWNWTSSHCMPGGQPIARPVTVGLLKARVWLSFLDEDLLFGFNIAMLAACGVVLYFVFRQTGTCPYGAMLLALFFVSDFRIRRSIETVDASPILSFVFGFSAILVLLMRSKAWVIAGGLFCLSALSREFGFFFALPLILLSSKRRHVTLCVVATVGVYLVGRSLAGIGSMFAYTDTFGYLNRVGLLSYSDLGWTGCIGLWIWNFSVALLVSFIPQLVGHCGEISLGGFISIVGVVETLVFLMFWWKAFNISMRGFTGRRDCNAFELGLLLVVCGAASQFFYYIGSSGLLGLGGVLVAVSRGIALSRMRWHYVLWAILAYRMLIVGKYFALHVARFTL